jgi:ABC-2 type transport system permease protein
MKNGTRSHRYRDLMTLFIGIGCVLLVLFIGSFTRLRADLTSEKRYTLSPATEQLMDSLPDVVFLKVYLSGELPADLRQLSAAMRELLDEMRIHNPELLQYEFVDPSASPDEKTRNDTYAGLQKLGLQYSSIRTKEKGAESERIVWPCAMLNFRGKSLPLQLLKTQYRTADADMVNRSINNLEFEVASAIRQVTSQHKASVAFLEGHGELDDLEVGDITKALEEQYTVSRVRIDGKVDALSDKIEGGRYRLNKYDALVIAKPDSAFSPKDAYIVDQFVMNGGRVLWALDPMNANLDSLRAKQFSVAVPLALGVDELLFAYGTRINKDLVIDQQCAPIQFYGQQYGDKPKLETRPFPFEPIVVPRSSHPIVNNIDPVHFKFVSSLDTIGLDSAHSTVLLTSSPYTRVLRNPVRISLSVVDMDLRLDKSTTPDVPVAVLTEGIFHSAFTDRLIMADSAKRSMGHRDISRPTAQLVISDGDVIANMVDRQKGIYYMLGFDRMARAKVYGNREFFINAMNYLLNDKSLISLRSRSITLRQLDPEKTARNRSFWQVLNVGAPILLSVLGGLLFFYFRRRRYTTS